MDFYPRDKFLNVRWTVFEIEGDGSLRQTDISGKSVFDSFDEAEKAIKNSTTTRDSFVLLPLVSKRYSKSSSRS